MRRRVRGMGRQVRFEQVALLDELPAGGLDPRQEIAARGIAFFDCWSRILRPRTLLPRPGEGNVRPGQRHQRVGISVVWIREVPAGVGGQRDRDFGMADAGDLVAVGIDLRNERR